MSEIPAKSMVWRKPISNTTRELPLNLSVFLYNDVVTLFTEKAYSFVAGNWHKCAQLPKVQMTYKPARPSMGLHG